MLTPYVTVLMPMYNAGRFLAEAVESILNQTFTQFEFLIIDDGSEDDSIAIIQSYKDSRIRLIKNEKNLGITATLNKGINLATASLIARMDADDISYPTRLEKQYNYITSHPECVLLSTHARVITEEKKEEYTDRTNSRFFYYNLTFASPMFHPSVMYRKQAVEDVGMYTMRYSEDFDLFWRLSRKFVIANLPEVLLDYRNNINSLHQVTKKQEYSEAALSQTIRNIRFFMGDEYHISEASLKCLQFDFEDLQRMNSIKAIMTCIHQLQFITGRILQTENINRNIEDIMAAAIFKQRYILSHYINNLPFGMAILLALKTRKFDLLKKRLKSTLYDFKRRL